MNNYELENDEVLLYENTVFRDDIKGKLNLILTSKKIIFCKGVKKKYGLFKTTIENQTIDIVLLKNIKIYNDSVQVKQKGTKIYIQTIQNNFNIELENIIEAVKLTTKIIDIITGTNIVERGTNKINKAINTVDNVVGFNTRDTIKGVVENGITGTILKGIKNKGKK
ncbi:MAG: hypothetical protein IJO32_02930 [Bacilli bacterium]|nr:hypothetical protein [Bacilli bacterium]